MGTNYAFGVPGACSPWRPFHGQGSIIPGPSTGPLSSPSHAKQEGGDTGQAPLRCLAWLRKSRHRLSSKRVGYETPHEMATCPPPNALGPSESEGTLCAFPGLAQQLPLTFMSSLCCINKPIHIGASPNCEASRPHSGSNADSAALLTNLTHRPILCRLLLSGTFKVTLQTESVRGEEGR